MTHHRFLAAVASCAAALLASPPAAAANATASPEASSPRTGAYRIVSRGAKVIRAKCLEGGHVVVPTRRSATAAQRDRAIHDACKTVDYSK